MAGAVLTGVLATGVELELELCPLQRHEPHHREEHHRREGDLEGTGKLCHCPPLRQFPRKS